MKIFDVENQQKKMLTALRIAIASLVNQTGYKTSSCKIDSNKSSSLSASNGGCPLNKN